MANRDYTVKLIKIKEIDNFEVVIIELPIDEINDKLTMLSSRAGKISKFDYESFVISTCIVNVNQLVFYIENDIDKLTYDPKKLRETLLKEVYKLNKSITPSGIIINKNNVLKINNKSVDATDSILLINNKYWDSDSRVNNNLDPNKVSKSNVSDKKLDINDLKTEIQSVWWARVSRYIQIKKFLDDDAKKIIDKYFPNKSNFNNFIVTVTLSDREELFSMLDNLGIPERTAPPLLIAELADLCIKVNPLFIYSNTRDDHNYSHGEQPKNDKVKSNSMSSYVNKKNKNKKLFKDVDNETLLNLNTNIKTSLIGQDNAVDDVVESIQRASIGLKSPDRPIGCFLFAGKTGIGKSVFSKILADELINDKDNTIIIDCSEYSADHEYAKLIGSSPGYIGFEQGGVLTNAITESPFSVVVFDELEKASKKVHNLLLQIMDEGRLTDGKGQTATFQDAIIIMTSNIGVSEIDSIKDTVGFGNVSEITEDKKNDAIKKALKSKFKPEFLNRIDAIVYFNDLKRNDYMKIIDIELYKLEDNLKSNDTIYKSLKLSFSNKLKRFIYKNGVDKEYGARPIKRCIEKHISTALAQDILKNNIDPMSHISLTIIRNKLSITVNKLNEPNINSDLKFMNC